MDKTSQTPTFPRFLLVLKNFLSGPSSSPFVLFTLFFFYGATSYFLKLASLSGLLESLGPNYYPYLLLAIGPLTYLFLNTWKELFYKNKFSFLYGLTFFSIIVCFSFYQTGALQFKSNKLILGILYVLSTNLLLALDLGVTNLAREKVSFLKNTKINMQLSFFEEFGIITSSCSVYLIEKGFQLSHYKMPLALISISVMGIVFVLFHLGDILDKKSLKNILELKIIRNPAENKNTVERVSVNPFEFPFLYWLLALSCLVLLAKNLQSLSFLIGIEQLSLNSSKYNLSQLFSLISIAQSSLIMAVLLGKAFIFKEETNWIKGHKLNAYSQFGLGIITTLFAHPLILISNGIFRKVIQHTLLEQSNTFLFSNIPEKSLFEVRTFIESRAHLVSFTITAVITFLMFQFNLDSRIAWCLGGVVGLISLYVIHHLFHSLTNFQVANITRRDLSDAINSCYGLANKTGARHAQALINILSKNPPPELAKAIIFSLGKMQAADSIPSLIETYKKTNREDIQLSVVQSLIEFKSHYVDYQLIEFTHQMIVGQTSLGAIRRSILRTIAFRIKSVALPKLFHIIENNQNEHRIMANAIMAIGEVASISKDHSLFTYLSKFLDEKFERRIRANAILYLYPHPQFRQKALDAFNIFLTSHDETDKSAVAYIVGELRLKGLIPFILDHSEKAHHKNSTLIIALAKLNYPKSYRLLADLIIGDLDFDYSMVAINQLSSINSKEQRYKVYYEVLVNYPMQLNYLVELMKVSNRDFDNDIQMIMREGRKCGLIVDLDDSRNNSDRPNRLKSA